MAGADGGTVVGLSFFKKGNPRDRSNCRAISLIDAVTKTTAQGPGSAHQANSSPTLVPKQPTSVCFIGYAVPCDLVDSV